MGIWPPYDNWRGQVIFALVFVPLGCVLRFELASRMNRLFGTVPMDRFAANVLGTCFLGMSYDVQHSSVTATSTIGCQVL